MKIKLTNWYSFDTLKLSMSVSTQPHYKRVESIFLAHEFLPKTREGITVKIVINKENNIHCGLQFGCGKIKIDMSAELWETIEVDNENWEIRFPSGNWNQNLKRIKKMLKHANDPLVKKYEEFAGLQLENGKLLVEEHGYDFSMKVEFDNNETVAFLEMIIELMEEWLDVVDFAENDKGRMIKAAR